MTVESAIVERLKSDSGVQAVVAGRVYQLVLPQNPTLPAIRVQLVDVVTAYHLRGEWDLTGTRIQVDAFASATVGPDPYASVSNVADAAHEALSAQRFAAGGSPEQIQVSGVFRKLKQVMYEAEELKMLRILQDYVVWSRPV